MNARNFVAGLLAGALLATAGSAFAADAYKKIAASLRPDLIVKVDGEKVNLQNAPLTYDGTTYVPLREAGEIFDMTVGYHAGTITLDSKEESTVNQPTETPAAVEWVSIYDLAAYGITAEVGDSGGLKLSGNGVILDFPEFKESFGQNGVGAFRSSDKTKTINVKYADDRYFFYLNQLIRFGLVTQ